MERASTCSLGEEGGVTELRCYHGFKFHTQPAPGRPWTCQTARRRRQHLPRHRQQQAGGSRQEQELKPPAVPVDVAVEASTWNACCRADKPASKASLHTKASQRHCPKGVAWQVASFLPSLPPPLFTDCNNCWRQICSHSQLLLRPFPFCENCDL